MKYYAPTIESRPLTRRAINVRCIWGGILCQGSLLKLRINDEIKFPGAVSRRTDKIRGRK
jgi:hypothetical protein